jgi:hypothetical protein
MRIIDRRHIQYATLDALDASTLAKFSRMLDAHPAMDFVHQCL